MLLVLVLEPVGQVVPVLMPSTAPIGLAVEVAVCLGMVRQWPRQSAVLVVTVEVEPVLPRTME